MNASASCQISCLFAVSSEVEEAEQSACFLLKDTAPVRRNVSPAGKLSAGKDPGWALLQSRANSPRKPSGCFAPSRNSLALRTNVCTNQFPESLRCWPAAASKICRRNSESNLMCPAGQRGTMHRYKDLILKQANNPQSPLNSDYDSIVAVCF